jgi:hypothetical protein
MYNTLITTLFTNFIFKINKNIITLIIGKLFLLFGQTRNNPTTTGLI